MTEKTLPSYQPLAGRDSAGLNERDILLVEQSFERILPMSEAFCHRFYQRLFVESPQLLSLFDAVNIEGQHKKLFASMVLLTQHLRDSDMIVDYLQGLGARHQQYGVKAEHFHSFIDNWVAVVAEFSGLDWHSDLEQAWRQVLGYVADVMQTSTLSFQQQTTAGLSFSQATIAECDLTFLAVEQTATPMLIVDLDGVVRYINAAAVSLLGQFQPYFQNRFPIWRADTLLNCSLQSFGEQLPFPIAWLNEPSALPRSIKLPNAVMGLTLTISALYKQDKAQGFLLECYPLTTESLTTDPLSFAASPADTVVTDTTASRELEQCLQKSLQQNHQLTTMLQDIDDALYESGLLALNCMAEAEKLGDEASLLREVSTELKTLNQQLIALLQLLKGQSGQQQQQLTHCLLLVKQIMTTHNSQSALDAGRGENDVLGLINQQLAQQTQALTTLLQLLPKQTTDSE